MQGEQFSELSSTDNMDLNRLLGVSSAFGAGALDTFENFAVNLSDKVWKRKPQPVVPLTGKTWLITGANAGIGYATAASCVQRGAHVILACRSPSRAAEAAEALKSLQPLPGCPKGAVEVQGLDLGSLKSVKQFCKRFNKSGSPLDVLVCNAGIMCPPERVQTEDGLETQFQVNFLGHWLLVHELLSEQRAKRHKGHKVTSSKVHMQQHNGYLQNGKQQNGKLPLANGIAAAGALQQGQQEGVRVVVLSSLTHLAGLAQWQDKQSLQHYSPFTSYALSKAANVVSAKEFQRRFDRNPEWGRDVAVSVHPGIVDTTLSRTYYDQVGQSAFSFMRTIVPRALSVFMPLASRRPDYAAGSVLLAGTLPAEKVAGRYMHNDRIAAAGRFTQDEARGVELWDLACALTGVHTHESLM